MEKKYYIKKLKEILREKRLDALVIYSSTYDDRFLKAIVGIPSILSEYILITNKDIKLSLPSYIVEYAKTQTTINILSAESEAGIIKPIVEVLGKNKDIGVIGNVKYLDIKQLDPRNVTDLTDETQEIISFKSDNYIKSLGRVARDLSTIVNSIKFRSGKSQKENVDMIIQEVIRRGYERAFPVCVTSGRDLKKSTSMLPRDKNILNRDLICVDMGIKTKIYTTDMTRMFFKGKHPARKVYQQICKIHDEIISNYISPNKTFRQVILEYRRRGKEVKLIQDVLETDFGHGVGFGLHEYPFLESTNRKIGRNVVFTIEPTYNTKYGKMRIEDMIAVKSNGEVVNLTQ